MPGKFKRNVIITAGAVVAALGAMALPADAATLPPRGALTLCSGGNYHSYATLPSRGGLSTYYVRRGTCQTFANWGVGQRSQDRINVYGLWNTASGSFFISTWVVGPGHRTGIRITTKGVTTPGHNWATKVG
jgi:hypothetical protein